MFFYKTLQKTGFIALFFLVFCPISQASEAEYEALVEQSRAMPEGYDFVKLRDLFQKSPDYAPYTLMPPVDFEEMAKAIDNDPSKADKLTADFEKKYFALPEGHSRLMVYFNSKQDLEKVAYHGWMFKGLMNTLMTSGDGKSAETAYKVLSVSEEYILARGVMDKKDQSLKLVGDRVYDVLSGPSKETGKSVEMWFDVTDLFGKGI